MIRPVGTVLGGTAAVRRGGAAAGRFRLPAEADLHGCESLAAATPAGLAGLLALQELPDARVADRAARRHAGDMVEMLAALQRALLGGEAPDLGRLAQLAASVPQAGDPALQAAVAAVVLRARIELARHGDGAIRPG